MYRVALNVSIYHLKQFKKRPNTIPISQETLELGAFSQNEDQAKWDRIRQQIKALNMLERGIIMLYLEGKSYKEIGQIIGISESNVGTKLTRIKAKLKSTISQKR